MGSFYLHCDPTASHYLKLILDAVFCGQGGDFLNEIIWSYKRYTAASNRFQRLHDVILYYSKSDKTIFNVLRDEYGAKSGKADSHYKKDENGKWFRWQKRKGQEPYKIYLSEGRRVGDVWEIPIINASAKERLGYPTQKPEALLERIIKASSNIGDTVLDAYCGCGTTIAVAEPLGRNWIGIDITYHSISLILKRMADTFGDGIIREIAVDGIPQDMNAAKALATRQDDRVRKEFEKWAALTYTNNRAVINTKKGADKGIDAVVYFASGSDTTERMIIQVKSGSANRATIATLHGDMEREKAQMATLITYEEPTKPMIEEVAKAGLYYHALMGRNYDRIQIVTIQELIEENKRIELPLSHESIKSAKQKDKEEQMKWDL
jgi:site-specific DNA-methyltransferase (adenine-specific)